MPAGQPTKFNKEAKRQLTLLADKGLTDAQVAEILGVHSDTYYNWKKAHPKFFDTIKNIKEQHDRSVTRSLRERALGFKCKEDKIFLHNGKPVIVPTVKHYPPDPTSMIFWLKNRQSDKWADKKEFDGKLTIEDAINAITG